MTDYRLSKVGVDTGALTDEEIRYIDTQIIKTVRPALIGRRIFSAVKLPDAGFRTWRKFVETDMSAASLDMDGLNASADRVELSTADVKIPMIHKKVKLFRRDILASRRGGLPLDTINIENAARQIAEEEDLLLVSGEYTGARRLGIQGLSSATGRNTQATAGTWGTIANIYTDFSAAISKLEEDGHLGPYDAIVRSALMARLRQLNTNTDTPVRKTIEEMLGGKVFVSDSLYSSAAATTSVLVVENKPENFKVGVAEDVQTSIFIDEDMNTTLKIFETLTPRIDHAAAICELTGVS